MIRILLLYAYTLYAYNIIILILLYAYYTHNIIIHIPCISYGGRGWGRGMETGTKTGRRTETGAGSGRGMGEPTKSFRAPRARANPQNNKEPQWSQRKLLLELFLCVSPSHPKLQIDARSRRCNKGSNLPLCISGAIATSAMVPQTKALLPSEEHPHEGPG